MKIKCLKEQIKLSKYFIKNDTQSQIVMQILITKVKYIFIPYLIELINITR